jgi:hypothetical protein
MLSLASIGQVRATAGMILVARGQDRTTTRPRSLNASILGSPIWIARSLEPTEFGTSWTQGIRSMASPSSTFLDAPWIRRSRAV